MATLPRYEPEVEPEFESDFEPRYISEEEYLNSDYEPDCDYVDGHLEERNLGERDHAFLQIILGSIFMNNRKSWGVVAATDWRNQVKRSNYRVPDLTILPIGSSKDRVLHQAPLLIVEILSPRDTLNAMVKRCQDYLNFGVSNIWIIDPESRKAWYCTSVGAVPVESGELAVPETPIRVGLAELFAELDAM
jgi:Uma2 family endonuclease